MDLLPLTEGAAEGFQTAALIPYLVAMLVCNRAFAFFRSAGYCYKPVVTGLAKINLPGEILPLAFLRPLPAAALTGYDRRNTAGSRTRFFYRQVGFYNAGQYGYHFIHPDSILFCRDPAHQACPGDRFDCGFYSIRGGMSVRWYFITLAGRADFV